MVAEDSEEVTLHCSIRGYHKAIWSTIMGNRTCSSVLESSYNAGGPTLYRLSDDGVHNPYVVAVKK